MRNPSLMKQAPKILKFYGRTDPKAYMDWEAKVEQVFNVNHVKDKTQVDAVVLGFGDHAKIWWHKVCKDNDQGSPTTSWRDIKTHMRAIFVPPSYWK